MLFVYLSDVFFGVTERFICKCSEEVQTCFCFCVDVCMYFGNVNPLSYVTPSVVNWLVYEISSPYSMTGGCSVFSLFLGVISVSVDFVKETFSLSV